MSKSERLCRSLLILLMGVAAAWGLAQILVPKPGMAQAAPPGTPISVKVPLETQNTPPAEPVEAADAAEAAEEPEPPNLYERRENFYTFLLIGMDKGGGNTDSLMLVSYDVDNQVVSVGSIARDTRVDVDRKLKKINAAYALNGGVPGLISEVSRTFGVPIDRYFRVNIRGFVRLVNAVGGVDFYVPCNMNYDDPYQDLSIHYSKGMQHLNGQQALEVCRFRQNSDGSGYGDGGRQSTQRGVLTAVAKKVLANPQKINEYIAIAQENLETDLSAADMAWFAAKAAAFNTENLNTMSMPSKWISPYMYLDPQETLDMVNQYFNPYTTERTMDQLDIITR